LFCEGYRVRFNPWFAHLPWRINRGQRMLVNIPGLMATSDRNAAVWRKQALLAPLGQDCYWLGSVNDWDLDDATPTAHAQATLMAQLHSLTDQPSQWLETKAGIRPVLRDRRPAVGFHPEHASLGLLNGLGTKGALLGPWFASALVDGLRSLFGWTDGGTAPESLEPGSAALWASVNPARFDG
jgi:glycine/D-amino acid oxidase-like deaminating enzyme